MWINNLSNIVDKEAEKEAEAISKLKEFVPSKEAKEYRRKYYGFSSLSLVKGKRRW